MTLVLGNGDEVKAVDYDEVEHVAIVAIGDITVSIEAW